MYPVSIIPLQNKKIKRKFVPLYSSTHVQATELQSLFPYSPKHAGQSKTVIETNMHYCDDHSHLHYEFKYQPR